MKTSKWKWLGVFTAAMLICGISAGTQAADTRVMFGYDAEDTTGIYINDYNLNQCGQYNSFDECVCDPSCVWDDNECLNVTAGTLRIFGEDRLGAAFPYETAEGPIDPESDEAPEKDFLTWNPAYMPDSGPGSNEFYRRALRVNGNDAREKVFLRQWFVPRYEEPRGNVWTDQAKEYTEDIVKEYTFMLLDTDNLPYPGSAGSTSFIFPIAYNNERTRDNQQIGLEGWDVDGDGVDDPTRLNGVASDTIDIGTGQIRLQSSSEDGDFPIDLEFVDHRAEVTFVGSSISSSWALVKIYYPSEYGSEDAIGASEFVMEVGDTLIAGRHEVNVGPDAQPTPVLRPWYLKLKAVDITTRPYTAVVEAGRLLQEEETFFSDGAEYDVAKIQIVEDKLLYITLRNPLPKDRDVELRSLTVTKAQVGLGDLIPMLPPFNKEHAVIDDIGLTLSNRGDDCGCQYPIVTEVCPVVERWARQQIEPRFRTRLCEILQGLGWDSLDIETLPDFYTELILPEQEDGEIFCDGTIEVAPGDYLLTSSFKAPNSEYARVAFAYDADPSEGGLTDVYINDGLRVYGEGSVDAAFPYETAEGPLDPRSDEAPPKDFITFNPAFMPDAGPGTTDFYRRALSVCGNDAHEKVFLRQWFVPEYQEPKGEVWTEQQIIPSADIVKEYTFMLVDTDKDPYPACEGSSFIFPAAYTDRNTDNGIQTQKALCFALDSSGSISPEDFILEKEGLARAVENPVIVPQDGSVILSVVQFSDGANVEVPATVINSPATASAAAALIRNIDQIEGLTNIAAAIDVCMGTFEDPDAKRVIDISTDGTPTIGGDPFQARDNAVAGGLDTLNGLGINLDTDGQNFLADLVYPQPAVFPPPYEDGFVIFVDTFADYILAVEKKIGAEVGCANNQIGLEGWDVNCDGIDDPTLLNEVNLLEGGKYIDISTGQIRLQGTETAPRNFSTRIQFLDHTAEINFVGSSVSNSWINVTIYYPSEYGREDPIGAGDYVMVPGDKLIAGRHAVELGEPQPISMPWYLELIEVDIATFPYTAIVKAGRLLEEGETFFSDGAEYDVARLQTEGDKLLYITLRNPLPKDRDVALDALTVVKAQVDQGDLIPLLPPFNKEHAVIDDIGLTLSNRGDDCGCQYPVVTEVDPVSESWIRQTIEPRFTTRLCEILAGLDWIYQDIQTLPDFYTEFILPEQEDGEIVCDGTIDVDPGDYLLTSSWVLQDAEGPDPGPDPTYCISGTVTEIETQNPLPGVMVDVDPGGHTFTESSGNYEICGFEPGAYAVIPTSEGYTFDPTQRDVVITNADVENVDFIGTPSVVPGPGTYSISGFVQDDEETPGRIQGVTIDVTLTGGGSVGTTMTGSDGTYSIANILEDGKSYTVTPSKDGCTFAPSFTAFPNVDSNQTGVSFTGTCTQPTTPGGGNGGGTTAPPAEDPPAEDPPAEDPPVDDEPVFEPAEINIDGFLIRSRFFILPAFLTIEGSNTSFNARTKVTFEPQGAVLKLMQRVVDEENIATFVLVMPSWLAIADSQQIGLKVTTGPEEASSAVDVKMLSTVLAGE